MIYGKRFRMAREARGITREDLAESVGLSELEVWKIEQSTYESLIGLPPGFESALWGLDLPLSFFSVEPIEATAPGSLRLHFPDDWCEVCDMVIATAECDFVQPNGTICSKRICDAHRFRPSATVDYCPDHGLAPFRQSMHVAEEGCA